LDLKTVYNKKLVFQSPFLPSLKKLFRFSIFLYPNFSL